jgi:hypothetical protein
MLLSAEIRKDKKDIARDSNVDLAISREINRTGSLSMPALNMSISAFLDSVPGAPSPVK